MDIIEISKQITEHINKLVQARNTLLMRATDKAEALGGYDKKLAITMLKLRNAQVVELDGEEISYTTTTGLEKVAKGVCYKESIALSLAIDKYKNAVQSMDAEKVIINALQSKLKYINME